MKRFSGVRSFLINIGDKNQDLKRIADEFCTYFAKRWRWVLMIYFELLNAAVVLFWTKQQRNLIRGSSFEKIL